ncbi:MAG: DUF3842 family protein [Clostridia bacterium]|nr:DUF3842 family protein [Clostridia bacterium]
MRILVIDAQGGGVGKQLVSLIKQEIPDAFVTAVGTNSTATAAMLKAGADAAATGENPVVVACRDADVIAGPVGMIIADALLGEITPKMALAVSQSGAKRVLIPFDRCDNMIAGMPSLPTAALLRDAVEKIKKICSDA